MKPPEHLREEVLSEEKERDIIQSLDPHYVLTFSDIETYNPSVDPCFWYGGFRDIGVDNDCRIHITVDDYIEDFLSKPKGKRKVIYYFNSSYDMSIIQDILVNEYGFTLNPREPIRNAIYGGNKNITWEIYTDDLTDGIIVLDSAKILNSSIRKWGNTMGFPKGETPIVSEYSVPSKSDVAYLIRDIEILYYASMSFGVVESTMKNKLTSASVAQTSFRTMLAEIEGKRKRTTGLCFKHSHKSLRAIDLAPSPKQLKEDLKRLTREFKAIRINCSNDGSAKFGITKPTVKKYEEKTRRSLFRMCKKQTDLALMQKQWAEVQDMIWNIEPPEDPRIIVKEYDVQGMNLNDLIKKRNLIKNNIDKITYDLLTDELPNKEKHIQEDIEYNILSGVNNAIQSALRGGVSYVNPKFKGKVVNNVATLDVNSLYPYIITANEIPNRFAGASKVWNRNKYYVMQVKHLKAKLKPNRHPVFKRNTRFVVDPIYSEEIEWTGKMAKGTWDTCLCSVDIEWLYQNYDVEDLTWKTIYYFEADKSFNKAIQEYIDHWRDKKEHAPNKTYRQYAKMHLNSLWGKWAMYIKEVDDAGKTIDVGNKKTELVSAVYTTAYARVYLNSMMNLLNEDLVYTDTDSVHFVIGNRFKSVEDVFNKLDGVLDDNIFGAWAFESFSDKGKYLKPKTYIHEVVKDPHTMEVTDNMEIKSAGATLRTYKDFGISKEKALSLLKTKDDPNLIVSDIDIDTFELGAIFFKNKSHIDDAGKTVIEPQIHRL